MRKLTDTQKFYDLLRDLECRIGGARRLGDCHGRMVWPERGVYFFFEPGERRSGDAHAPRVVRVGSHALRFESRTTLWNRLSQHRGTTEPPGGNHRGSIFRLLIGEAMLNAEPSLSLPSWGKGSSAVRAIREGERENEKRVSQYIGAMSLLCLDVPASDGRATIERNSIALLSGYRASAPDPPCPTWLGRSSSRERVRRSGLWNNAHVDEDYSPDFLCLFEGYLRRIPKAGR